MQPWIIKCVTLLTLGFLTQFAITMHAVAQDTSLHKTTPLYVEPPAPSELAQHLFGPRYRSAGYFGMRIQFAFDSAMLRPESLPLLDSVGEMMKLPESKGRTVMVEGHTDGVGSAHYNNDLSLRRANAVVTYLTQSFDLPRTRFSVSGKGESDLLEPEDPAADINRRAVFRAIQKLRLK